MRVIRSLTLLAPACLVLAADPATALELSKIYLEDLFKIYIRSPDKLDRGPFKSEPRAYDPVDLGRPSDQKVRQIIRSKLNRKAKDEGTTPLLYYIEYLDDLAGDGQRKRRIRYDIRRRLLAQLRLEDLFKIYVDSSRRLDHGDFKSQPRAYRPKDFGRPAKNHLEKAIDTKLDWVVEHREPGTADLEYYRNYLAGLDGSGEAKLKLLARIEERTPAEQSIPGSGGGLRAIARDGDWVVFNRQAFRDEVIAFIWGDAYEPRRDELWPRSRVLRTPEGIELETSDTHWRIAAGFEGFNDPRLVKGVRPERRTELERLPEISDSDRETRPDWVPGDVWRALLTRLDSGETGVQIYQRRSPTQTDIVGVVSNAGLGMYAEMIEEEARLYALRGVLPPGKLELLTGQSSEQAAIRWLTKANRDYNKFMLREVKAGRTVREAHDAYADHAHRELVVTILKSIQRGLDSGTGKTAQAAVGAFQLVWGLVSD